MSDEEKSDQKRGKDMALFAEQRGKIKIISET